MEEVETTDPFDSLPDEVFYDIFKFLNAFDIKCRMALVSKRWYELTKNPRLITELTFKPSQSLRSALNLLYMYRSLSKLTICSRRDANEILKAAAEWNKKLRSLRVHTSRDTRPTDLSTEVMVQVLASCTSLREVTLKRTNFDFPETFFKELGKLGGNLRKINLNHSLQLGDEELTNLLPGLNDVEDLRIYCLSFNSLGSLTPYGNGPVVQLAMRFQSTLTTLKLNMLGLTDDVMPYVTSCLLLKVLHLYRVLNVNDDGIVQINRLSMIEELVVTVPRAVTASGWSLLLSQENIGNLKHLNISNSDFVDDGVLNAISENCPLLENLALPGCRKITDEGVGAVIRRCSCLKELNLYSTKSIVAQSFHLIPTHMASLKTLIYRPIDAQATELSTQLTESLKTLQVRSVYR